MEKKIKVTTEEILYLAFFCMIFFAKGIGLYDGQAVFKAVLVLAGVFLFLKICIGSYSYKELLKMAVIVLITGLVYINSGDKGMLLYGLMIIGLKNVKLEYLLKAALVVWSIAFGALWMISLMQMDDIMYRVASKLGMEHIFRWSMGYAHPNVLHITYLILAALILLVAGEKINWKYYAGLTLGNLFVFLYSVSYTGVAIVFFMLLGRGYLQFRRKLGKLEQIMLSLLLPFCITISLLGPILLKGRVFDILNKILNTRLSLSAHYLKPEYLSLFGTRLSEITTPQWTMDNAYVFALIAGGIIPFALLCVTYVYLIISLIKTKQYLKALVALSLAAAGLTEPFLFNTSFKNISFLFFGGLLFSEDKRKNKKEICIFRKGNQEISIQLDQINDRWHCFKQRIKQNRGYVFSVIAAGAAAGIIIYNFAVKIPEGYVVRRSYCEDISEEIKLYEKDNPLYKEFYHMEDFEQGEEIEYFTGDIVWMERVRGSFMSFLIGALLGSLIMIVLFHVKKECRNDKKN